MTRKHRCFFPLILTIALLLVTSTAYCNYYSLMEADFLYRGLKFESSDLDDLFVDRQNIWDLKPSSSCAFSLLDNALRQEPATLFSIHPSFDPFTSILRC